MLEGWIKIQRAIVEHWIWNDPIKLKWWLDLLMLAGYSDSKVNVGLQIFDCGRGQIITSLSALAKRWGATKDRVRNFLVLLSKEKMITHESLTKSTRITICNYERYQSDLHDSQTIDKRSPNANQTLAKRSIYIKENKKERRKEDIESNRITLSSTSDEVEVSKPKVEQVQWKKIVEMWNETCKSFPKVFSLSENRKNKMRLRVSEMGGSEKAMEILKGIFAKMEESSFLKGDNRRGWKASFDWLFENDKNWVKVWEGNYDNEKPKSNEENQGYYPGGDAKRRRDEEFGEYIKGKLGGV